MRTLPSISSAISSRVGATIRQGPHQEAQKSTSTGTSDFRTSLSKVSLVTLTTLSLAIGSDSPFSPSGAGKTRHSSLTNSARQTKLPARSLHLLLAVRQLAV